MIDKIRIRLPAPDDAETIAEHRWAMFGGVRGSEGFKSVALYAGEDGGALYESLEFRPTTEMPLRLRG